MRVLSLFAGIEGFGLGFEQAGARIVGQVEIDKFCQRVLAWHYPDVPKWEDVRNVGRHNLPACDVLTGGSPCQDLSVVGRRAGLAGERSGLFYEMARIADELSPDWVCWENVPGALSSNRGEDFACVLEGFTGYRPGVPAGGWRNSGVCIGPKRAAAWRVLDAQYFGVAQRRRRVFLVCHARNRAYPAKVLFEPESCSGDSPPSRGEGSGTAGCVSHSLKACGNCKWDATHETCISVIAGYQGGDLGHALRANPSKADKPDSSTYVINKREGEAPYFGVRRLTPVEAERLQGFPDGWTAVDGDKTPDSPRYRALGNAVCVPVARWIAQRMIEIDKEAAS